MEEIYATPERTDTPVRVGTPTRTIALRRLTFYLEDQANKILEEPDIMPRMEVPSSPVYETPEEPPNTPEEPPRRSQRTRRAPARFGNPIME